MIQVYEAVTSEAIFDIKKKEVSAQGSYVGHEPNVLLTLLEMDVLARRRSAGKGAGEQAEDSSRIEGTRARNTEAAEEQRVATTADVAGATLQGLQGVVSSGDGDARSSRASELGNPFWSDRAREELQLQLARPDFLGSAEASGSRYTSSSTELREVELGTGHAEGPVGRPVVYGPTPLQTTVGEVRRDQTVEGSNHEPRDTRSLEGQADPTAEQLEQSHGLSSRERYILSQMKDAMVRIAQQNEQLVSQNEALWSRVARLEEEKSTTAFHSASDPLEAFEQRG